MLPSEVNRYFQFDKFFAYYYPPTQSCLEIDKQLGSLTIDLDKITKMRGKMQDGAMIKKVKDNILLLIKARENQSALLDCRNKIENIRQNETATLFEEKSISSEQRILSDNKNKQYLLIGIGATIIITTLFIIIKKQN